MNIDAKISQAEAEWRRYRYETIGIRESIRELCGAVKRSMKKRINRLIRTIRARMKGAGFSPSYVEGRENVVVSLTSTPDRIRYIFPTLYSLAAQTHKPDLIVLWLGSGMAYPEKIVSRIRELGILVEFRDDLGPNTKYHYAFSEYQSDLVITVDDDIIYHENMVEELYRTYLERTDPEPPDLENPNPESPDPEHADQEHPDPKPSDSEYPDPVIARRVHRIRFGHDRKPLRYTDWIWEYRDALCPSHDLLATGVGGVLYPPYVMALECWKNMDFLKISPKADDIWLKFCELSCGIRICAVRNAGFCYDVKYHKTRKNELAAENVDMGRNDEYVRSCAKYFGMSDDLCERMLAEDRYNGF